MGAAMAEVEFPLQRLHMLNIHDAVPVLPSTQAKSPRGLKRMGSLLIEVPEAHDVHDHGADDYREYNSDGHGLESMARISRNGTIDLQLNFKNDSFTALPQPSPSGGVEVGLDQGMQGQLTCPAMNIVIMLVGSRGDIQPYVALGKALKRDGHRVRIATHSTFEAFVVGQDLEFFSIGGNPQDLMSYMVKNPGLVPGFTSLTNGDIKRNRKMLKEMIHACWSSCIEPATNTSRPFVADAIIANPPSFAHVHCAEALGIPLLMSFTMPWTPTTAFPHPLVNITQTNAGFGLSNYLSYAVADLLTWQGIGDIVNSFRTSILGLAPLTLRTGPDILDRLKVPWTYCMSPSIVPKPSDWKSYLDVVGFYFLDLAAEYEPSSELATFLKGPPPIYVGFGSVVVDDPATLSNIIFEATSQANVRAVVSSGWGGLGGVSVPSHVFMVESIPHDWLFSEERVAAVVHHGGAGTTAIGLAKGRPTVIVPFFGDQAFWGNMVHQAGAGPKPIPKADLTVKKLRDAILFALSASARQNARNLAERIEAEDGVTSGVASFYRHMAVENMMCDLDHSRIAVWWSPQHCMKLSAFAAQTLEDANFLSMSSLEVHETKSYHPKKPSSDSSNSANAKFWSITQGATGLITSPIRKVIDTTMPISILKTLSLPESLKPSASPAPIASPSHSRAASFESIKLNKPLPATPPQVLRKPSRRGNIPPTVLKKPPPPNWIHTRSAEVPSKLKKPPPSVPLTRTISDPTQEAWKSTQSDVWRLAQEGIREHRIEQGREAVKISTEAERGDIVAKFSREVNFTPVRQERYREEVEKVLQSQQRRDIKKMHGALPPLPEYAGSTLVSSPPASAEGTTANTPDGEDEEHQRRLEEAIRLSLEEFRLRETMKKKLD